MSYFDARSPRRRGFTLVEMLVVLAIIGVLAALLLPAVMSAIVAARRAAVAIELNQLTTAIESYKQDKGDYPPNFRDPDVLNRHIRKCFPKIAKDHYDLFLARVTSNPIDEGECLVFWLSLTDNSPRYPFLPYLDPTNSNANPKKYYEFDQTRLKNIDGDNVYSYQARNCQDTFYIYIDSRSYDSYANTSYDASDCAHFQGSESTDTYAKSEDGNMVRPYWSKTQGPAPKIASNLIRNNYKPQNPTTFQLICAGLDGEFGLDLSIDSDVKAFPTGDNYLEDDKDNIANFSGGKPLRDSIP